VLITTKGEGIALGIAQMSTVEMSSCDHGVVAKIKRCIMERDLYPRRWGLGSTALEKKKLKAEGKLDKFGRPNDATPTSWSTNYKDYSALENGNAADTQVGEKTTVSDVLAAPPVHPAVNVPADEDEAEREIVMTESTPVKEGDFAAEAKKEKRKKHEGETPEERAERKRRRKEKKGKKGKGERTEGKEEGE